MALSWDEIRDNAFKFSKDYEHATSEKSEAHNFVSDFLKVFGVNSRKVGTHEYKVKKKAIDKGYMDYLWPGVIAIEMKSAGQDLNKAYTQLEGYVAHLNKEDMPELLMVSDLQNIWVSHRTDKHQAKFTTKELCDYVNEFSILANKIPTNTYEKQEQVNIKASEKMAKLHKAMKESGYEGHKLQVYLVRLLFCLFADDSGIFHKNIFLSCIENSKEDGSDLAGRLNLLFDILNMPEEERQKQTVLQKSSPDLFTFPYVNGGLFAEVLRTPAFDAKMRQTLLDACHFDWKSISPAIFGAMFQGVMDGKERHDLGAHYTSEENILKVIKPLFLDDLWDEFRKVKNLPKRLEAFHNKLASLKFLDPACGCGNFLIVAYKELRELEIEVIKILKRRMLAFDTEFISKVRVSQFYGIEIEEFPCQVAQVSMWLIHHLMNLKLREFAETKPSVPLLDKANIVCGNALTLDWNEVVPSSESSYILGNPPFLGARVMNKEQKAEIKEVFGNIKQVENLDYVCAWYKKASSIMKTNNNIRTSFVSTSSITQGEQVSILWKELFSNGFYINFAYTPFKWSNEAKNNAMVWCVIVGFSLYKICKFIYDENSKTDSFFVEAKNINAYLRDGKSIFVESRSEPISNVPSMKFGSMPRDGGHFVIHKEEYDEIVTKEPKLISILKPYIGADEFLRSKERWCIWLHNEPLNIIANSKILQQKISLVEKFRLDSKAKTTNQYAKVPSIFAQIAHPYTNYMIIPEVSSDSRTYIPIGFMDKDTIASNKCMIVPNADTYMFGILTSIVHMAWMRSVAGRHGNGYNYSKEIVYNNFPWIEEITPSQKAKIEQLAQKVLDTRKEHSDVTLAFLYSKSMPSDLRKAHENLDREVMKLYGYSKDTTENEIVADLLNRYEKLIEKEKLEQTKTAKKPKKQKA